MTGTGFLSASTGNQMRAASFVPSGRGMKVLGISLVLRGKVLMVFMQKPGSGAGAMLVTLPACLRERRGYGGFGHTVIPPAVVLPLLQVLN